MWNYIRSRLNDSDSYLSMFLGFASVFFLGLFIFNLISVLKQPSKSENTQQQTKQAENKSIHIVKTGETLWSIAEIYYKSGYNWIDIRDANNITKPEAIEIGQTLTIPNVAVRTVEQGQITTAAAIEKNTDGKNSTYTVKKGDTLWDIAVLHYGNGFRWTDIARANNLSNPQVIHAGNVFTIPE